MSGPYQAGVASGHTSLVGSLLPLLIPGAGLYASLYTRPTLAGTILIQSLHPWEILHCMAVNQIWLATKSSMGLFTRSGRPCCCQWAQISFPPSVWGGRLAKKLFGWGIKSHETQRGKGFADESGTWVGFRTSWDSSVPIYRWWKYLPKRQARSALTLKHADILDSSRVIQKSVESNSWACRSWTILAVQISFL